MKKSIEEYKKQATLTVEEVADILRVSRSKAYEIVKQGYFPFKKINHTIRIPTEPFFEWLNSYSSDEMITDSPKEERVFDKDIILKNKKIIKEEKVS
ncbi:MAG TPA: helix-turn-helix domain-containing protein [Clostridia bacterium]